MKLFDIIELQNHKYFISEINGKDITLTMPKTGIEIHTTKKGLKDLLGAIK